MVIGHAPIGHRGRTYAPEVAAARRASPKNTPSAGMGPRASMQPLAIHPSIRLPDPAGSTAAGWSPTDLLATAVLSSLPSSRTFAEPIASAEAKRDRSYQR